MRLNVKILINDLEFEIEETDLFNNKFWIRRINFPYFIFFKEVEDKKSTNTAGTKIDINGELKKYGSSYHLAIKKFNKLTVFI